VWLRLAHHQSPLLTRLLKFLLRRGGAKDTILRVLFDAIKPGTQCELGVISQMFDQINHIYARRMLGAGMSPQGVVLPQFGSEAIVINQSDMCVTHTHTHTHTHTTTTTTTTTTSTTTTTTTTRPSTCP